MVLLGTLVVLGLALALVMWRRRVIVGWRPSGSRRVGAGDSPWCTRVWSQREQPRRSPRAGVRVTGELCVDVGAGVATLRVPDGLQVMLTNVRRVQVVSTRADFANTWVEVDCDVNGMRTSVYFNDAAWLGWRPLLTGANTRLADAVASLMAK
jgi:hypothetical protein